MRWILGFGRFWYAFIVGDDWTIAVGVIVAVILTAAVAHLGLTAWPVLPIAVIGGLAWSVKRVPSPPPHSPSRDAGGGPSL